MPNEPAFPEPRPEASVYRRPSGGPEPEALRARRVVTRPEPPEAAATAHERERQEASALAGAERLARRQRMFVVRRPRAAGAAALAVGLAGLAPRMLARLWGEPLPGATASFGGAVLAAVGLWLLAAGLPLRADGEPRGAWTAGLAASATLAALAHVALTSLGR